ncbi:hypothetical protein [Odoribacter lunatus]|uniref:hypothetical protein n=1 Tax=Odoribacter lunatus TaxID=2941335 RepID=UPI00203CE50A|nr:hypothetical protein [Odoribacter lunatus]
MSKKELKGLEENRFVPGIYNFCDKWCEKCTKQTVCLNYVLGERMEQKLGRRLTFKDLNTTGEDTWGDLNDIFDSTYEVLCEVAKEKGVDVEGIFEIEEVEKKLWQRVYEDEQEEDELDDSSPVFDVIRECLIYESLCDTCLEAVFGILDEQEWKEGMVEEQETGDALDKINWYLDVIQIKMRRALLIQQEYREGDCECEIEEKDYNGSAKVALIGIESSARAWEVLKKYCPALEKEIIHIQTILQQLVRDIEKYFPKARSFRRPGFD